LYYLKLLVAEYVYENREEDDSTDQGKVGSWLLGLDAYLRLLFLNRVTFEGAPEFKCPPIHRAQVRGGFSIRCRKGHEAK
jgi:hypothetical protein